VGHPPTHECQNYPPGTIRTSLPCGSMPHHDQPPMLAQHLPRAHKGQGLPAHAMVSQGSCLIRHLATTQKDGIGFVWDAPVESHIPADVQDMTGPSTVLNAPKWGSGAPPHAHLAKPSTQGGVGRGLLEPERPYTNGQRHTRSRRAWLMANVPRRHYILHHKPPHITTPI